MTLPSIEATSGEALALNHFAHMIRDSESWRRWLGVSGGLAAQTRAAARLWLRQVPTRDLRRPLAVFDVGRFTYPLLAEPAVFDVNGQLGMVIEADTPPEYQADAGSAYIWFNNHAGDVWKDVLALAGQAGYLNIQSAETQGPIRSDEAEEAVETGGDYWQQMYVVEYR